MKKLLLSLILGASATFTYAQQPNAEQSVQDTHHNILGYLRGGAVMDAQKNVIGNFKFANDRMAVVDKNQAVLGYVYHANEIQDASKKTIGYLVNTPKMVTVQNADKQTIGYINIESGRVEDNNHTLIGYEVNTEATWVAPYFFFFHFQG